MTRPTRLVEDINQALHAALCADPDLYLLGEDIVDPYGGAFKATRGLSTAFPDRVLTTPISESAIIGMAAGLALAGDAAVAEMMFGDFVALAFDQLVNFASKSVSMYGRRVPLRLVVRCPSGGRRGYGPTHSQSLQKHFIGVPGLSVFEISQFHSAGMLLPFMLNEAEPCLLFEDKVLYTRAVFCGGVVDDIFSYQLTGRPPGIAVVYADSVDEPVDCLLIAPGGMAERALAAMRTLLLDDDVLCRLLVPARLYPFDVATARPLLGDRNPIVIAEDGTAGGTWGSELAYGIHRLLWETLPTAVRLVHAAPSVIPAAVHQEQEVLPQPEQIRAAVLEVTRG
jgi:pyruvate/2-oxoglutarate/acetoin dehydrogenase E1 component